MFGVQNCKLNFECDNPRKFLKSQWQKEDKSLNYVIYRIAIAAFFIFSGVDALIYQARRGQILISIIYLTELNMIATVITCTIGAYYVVLFYFGKFNPQDRMTFGLKFYWFMHNTIVPFACEITLVYWMLLHETHENISFELTNILIHLANSLVLLIDLLVIQHECRILHFLYTLAYGTLYLIFSIIYTYLGGVNTDGYNFIYPMVDWKEKPKEALIFCVYVYLLLVVFHLMMCGISKLRQMLHNHLLVKSKIKGE